MLLVSVPNVSRTDRSNGSSEKNSSFRVDVVAEDYKNVKLNENTNFSILRHILFEMYGIIRFRYLRIFA